MNLLELRKELALFNKNGIAFLSSASIVWVLISLVFMLPFEVGTQNILMLYATGLTFPVAVMLSKWMDIDWKSKENPLNSLSLYLNMAQFIYFPILFWAFLKSPTSAVLFFAVITAAHLYPYGWLYATKAFYFFAPVLSTILVIIGLFFVSDQLWMIPLTMAASLLLLNVVLYQDYKQKRNASTPFTESVSFK
ncbi:hypothetical protein EQV77_07260 [Halobacillus fulvus]|nr:hypothetical protein EQV77_07260 [Halobacillus fulvus]